MARRGRPPGGSNRLSTSDRIRLARARYESACRGNIDGREHSLVELAQRKIAWMHAIEDHIIALADERRAEVAAAVELARAH